jgi:hypothetical protein
VSGVTIISAPVNSRSITACIYATNAEKKQKWKARWKMNKFEVGKMWDEVKEVKK